MTAVSTDVMPRRLTPEQWEREWGGREDAYELVEGIPTVAAAENYLNRLAASLLAQKLWPIARPDFIVVTDAGVHVGIRDGQHTVRLPDVVVRTRSGDRSTNRAPAHEIALLAEVVSPSSVENDWIVKRVQYAVAGIPAYLVVDVADQRRITLFTDPVDGDYRRVGGGCAVNVTLAGRCTRIAIRDLVIEG